MIPSVASWAADGNTTEAIPNSKLPDTATRSNDDIATIVRGAVSNWAEEGNRDTIPSNKLPADIARPDDYYDDRIDSRADARIAERLPLWVSDAGTDIPAEKLPEMPPAGWGSAIFTLPVNGIHREAINIRTASVFQATSFTIQPNRHYIVSIYDKGSQSSIPSGALAQAMIKSNNLRALPAISASDAFSLDSNAAFISIQGVDDDTLSAGFSNIYRLGRNASNTLLIASSSENDDAFPLIIEEFVLTTS